MKSHEERYEIESAKKIEASKVKEERKEGYAFSWFRIDGQLEEPIPTLLIQRLEGPTGKLLLFLHGFNGKKEDVFLLKDVANAFGFSMLAIDARLHGDRKEEIIGISPISIIAGLGGTVLDNRLALDVAFRNGWADRGKIVLAGTSMGGILGGVTAGIDKRIAGAVLYVPGGDLADIMARSTEPTVARIAEGIPRLLIRSFEGQLASIDPINYIDRISPRPLLIQLGRHDDIVPFDTGMKLFNRAKEPKQLVVHDSGHSLPMEEATAETVQWLRKNFPALTS